MHKFFKSNLTYRIISLLLAVSLWLWVTAERNPALEKVLTVPLETKNLADELTVAEQPDSVIIRVEGRKKIIDSITSRDVKAFVDLNGASIGPNIKPVEVNLPSNLQLVSVNPSQVSIIIDEVSEVQLPVSVNIQGDIATGHLQLQPETTPAEVLVEGPGNLLDAIDKVYVDVSMANREKSFLEYLPVKIRDKRGKPLGEWLTIKPEYVEVYIPVIKEQPSQKMLIKPDIAGTPAKGYKIKRVDVEPDIVEAYGPYQSLSTLDYLITEPVLVNGLSTDLIRDAEIIVPDDNIEVRPKTVKIIVELEKE